MPNTNENYKKEKKRKRKGKLPIVFYLFICSIVLKLYLIAFIEIRLGIVEQNQVL